MDRRDLAAQWQDGLSATFAGFEAYQARARDGVGLDWSLRSLRALESQALQRFSGPDAVLGGDEAALVRAYVAYVGLALARLGAGSWDWDGEQGFAERARPALTDPAVLHRITEGYWGVADSPAGRPQGIPVVVPDAALGVAPVSPLHLLVQLVTDRPAGDGPWARTYEAWSRTAGAAPSGGVPGVDVFHRPPASAVLDGWLSAREAGFAAWAARYPGGWDFSPQSIDALTGLVLERMPAAAAVNDYPANADLLDGACWYLGEIFRRARPSAWVYREWEPDPGDPQLICFAVQLPDDTDYKTPFSLLRLCAKTRAPRARQAYEAWAP